MNRQFIALLSCIIFIIACESISESCSTQAEQVTNPYHNLKQFIEVIEKSDASIPLDTYFCKQYFCSLIEKLDFHSCSKAIFYSGQLEYQQDSLVIISLFYEYNREQDQLNSKLLIALDVNRDIGMDAMICHSKGVIGNENIKIQSELKYEEGLGLYIYQKLYDSKQLNQYQLKNYWFDSQGNFNDVSSKIKYPQ